VRISPAHVQVLDVADELVVEVRPKPPLASLLAGFPL